MNWSKPRTSGTGPSPRFGHSAAGSGTTTYFVFGGTNGQDYFNDLYRYTIKSSKWEQVSSTGDIPSPRAYHSIVEINNHLFLFGGSDGHREFNDLYVYSIGMFY